MLTPHFAFLTSPDTVIPWNSVGGKGGGLLQLRRLQSINVPTGLILTTSYFDAYLRATSLDAEVSGWRQSPDRNHGFYLASAINRTRIPPSLRRELVDAVRFVWGHTFPVVAVRSSATVEDQQLSSAAGQFRTVIPVDTWAQLEAAIRAVWASLFHWQPSPGDALLESVSMAVVVQQVVDAWASGVAFGGEIGVVVEAVRGPCGPMVSGDVTPDRWEFDSADGALLRKRIAPRGRSDNDDFCISMDDLTASEIASKVLSMSQIRGNIDVEFCIDNRKELHFVQIRPQTRPLPRQDDNPLVSTVDTGDSHEGLDLEGDIASWGAASGRLIILEPGNCLDSEVGRTTQGLVQAGDILLTSTLNIGATLWINRLAGIVAERGGTLSHSAILARENQIPAIVGASGAISSVRRTLHNQLVNLAPGVWMAPAVTLNATSRQLFAGARRIVATPLIHVLPRRSESTAVAPRRAQEWAHFIETGDDARQVDWTGKPEYRLCALQLDLSHKAWRTAFRIMGLSALDIPLIRSIVSPYDEPRLRSDGSWIVGEIRPGQATRLSPRDFEVIAFPTEELCGMGDRLLEFPVGTSKMAISPRVRRFHALRKLAFERLASCTAELAQVVDIRSVSFRRVLRTYATAVAFAHARASFRRRVALVLHQIAWEALPSSVRPIVKALIEFWDEGAAMETTHRRDVEFRELAGQMRTTIRRCKTDPGSAAQNAARARDFSSWQPRDVEQRMSQKHPDLHSRILAFAETYKFDRSDKDLLDTPATPTRVIQSLLAEIQQGQGDEVGELRCSTAEGFRRRLQSFRPLILSNDPKFDCPAFEDCLTMAWEIPSMTDLERHLQHRFQQQLRKRLIELQQHLRGSFPSGDLPSLFEISHRELLNLTERTKNHAIETTAS